MMPRNKKLALVHRLAGWTATAEFLWVNDKNYVSQLRNEVQPPAYSPANLRSSCEWKYARIDIGLENASNKFCLLPLGGAYLGQGNSMTSNGIPWGMSVPGMGRSLNVALNVNFRGGRTAYWPPPSPAGLVIKSILTIPALAARLITCATLS